MFELLVRSRAASRWVLVARSCEHATWLFHNAGAPDAPRLGRDSQGGSRCHRSCRPAWLYDAFMGEHLTDRCENITNSMMFQASLVSDTRQIKLATGTANLSHMHPVLIAVQAAMFDHMAEGRFILGVSPGALTTDAEALGILEQDRNKMFAESIDVILAIWQRDPPYDIEFPDNRYKVSTGRTMTLDLGVGIMGKPYQKPRPEIVGTVVAPYSPGVVLMGKRDFHPLSANFLLSCHLKSHWQNYCKGKAEVGAEAK